MVKRLFVHLDRCIGCQAHSVACQRVHLGTVTLQSTFIEKVGNLPVVCRHCEEPACVAACPREAMTRDDDGTVRRNPARCTGCRSCVLACPFGVLSQGMKLIGFALGKCDLCTSRLEEGREPACVATCPTGALRFEEMSDAYGKEKEIVLGAHAQGYRTYIRRP
ncbi:4Fe-4S dicluster domain-containing protein [bacterium]|nr:4Fe-4S dicluster domain-containing protein [bacterium]